MKRLIALIAAILIGGSLYLVLADNNAKPIKASPSKITSVNLIAKQNRIDDCVLASIATVLNYDKNEFLYTSAGLQLAYIARYGKTDWAANGDTSHQAQQLVELLGYNPEYGQLKNWGGVEALKYLAWAGRRPIIFYGGSPQHAVVALTLDGEDIEVADVYSGEIFKINATTLYNKLEDNKWYFTLKR